MRREEKPASGREAVLDRFGVSRETVRRLDRYVEFLEQWQQKTNLVGAATLGEVWTRHVADSLQFRPLAPNARSWVDLGSGGGFPGLVIAIGCAEAAGASVALIESNAKKAAFLRAVVRDLALPAAVHAARIEAAGAVLAQADAVSARALASLDALCELVAGRISPQAPCFFAKGRHHGEEIVDASRRWRFTVVRHASRVENGSAILEIGAIQRRAGDNEEPVSP